MSLSRVRCRLSFNSPKDVQQVPELPSASSSSSSVPSVVADCAVAEQRSVSSIEAHKRRLESMRSLADDLEKTKWMYDPLPSQLSRGVQ